MSLSLNLSFSFISRCESLYVYSISTPYCLQILHPLYFFSWYTYASCSSVYYAATSYPFAIQFCKCLLAGNATRTCFYVINPVADITKESQATYDVVLFKHRLYERILNTHMVSKAVE